MQTPLSAKFTAFLTEGGPGLEKNASFHVPENFSFIGFLRMIDFEQIGLKGFLRG